MTKEKAEMQLHLSLDKESHKKLKVYCAENELKIKEFVKNTILEKIKAI